METGTVATGKMRVSVGLTVTGAVLLMAGVITMCVGAAMRLKSPHGWQGIVGLGEIVAACGLGCGLALLVAVIAGRPRRGIAARSRAIDRSRPIARSHSIARSRDVAQARAQKELQATVGSRDAVWSGSAGWPTRSDRRQRQSRRAGHTWNGAPEDAWRRDSADDWLSPLRNSSAAHAAEPARWPGQDPVSAFVPPLDYADDGWQPDTATASSAADSWPAEPQARRPVGGHRAGVENGQRRVYMTGPQPGYVTGPQPGYVTGPQPGYVTGPQPGYVTGPQHDHMTSPQSGHESVSPLLPASRSAPYEAARRQMARYQTEDASKSQDDPDAVAAADTAPLPVILPSMSLADRDARSGREIRCAPERRHAEGAGAHRRPHNHQPAGAEAPPEPAPGPAPANRAAPAQAKLDQIKDLYLTAAAIGENALVRHFEEVSQRQRALIREYFEQSGFGLSGPVRKLADIPAQNEAPLPR